MSIPIHIKNKKTNILLIALILLVGITIFVSANNDNTKKLSDVAVGDFFAHYQNNAELKDINTFYDSIKKFSKDTIQKCQNSQEKDECINQQITNAKDYNLIINNCQTQTVSDKTNLQEIKTQNQQIKDEKGNYGFHTIQGQVIQITQEEQTTPPTLTLNQTNQIINVTLGFAGLPIIKESQNKYIKLEGTIQEINLEEKELTMRLGKIGESEEREKYITINPTKQQTNTLKDIAKQIANCAYSKNQTCLCEITMPQQYDEIFFEKDNFHITEDKKYYVPTTIRQQDLSNRQKITPFNQKQTPQTPIGPSQEETQPTEEVFSMENLEFTELEVMSETKDETKKINLTKKGHKIQLKKQNDEMIIIDNNVEANLKTCEVETKTYLFCTQYQDPNNYYKEKPQMNFALKI